MSLVTATMEGETGEGGRKMGGKRGKRRCSRAKQAGAVDSARRAEKWEHYDDIKRENDQFTTYYRKQELVPEEEWPVLMEYFGRSLPTTFRITGFREEAEVLKRMVEEDFATTLPTTLQPLPWYRPKGLAWHLDSGRKMVRTDESHKAFHKWLVAVTDDGGISRQEAVSMIPPLLLNVRAGMTVLDLCAAPGSKTAQIVEYMHADALECGLSPPDGLVMANDASRSRAYMLCHQAKRLLSPTLLVTNNDGTIFPPLHLHDVMPANEEETGHSLRRLLFDRILVDVPCSGDGTFRKNALLWKSWTPQLGLGLHSLQVRLLERAIRLLRVGGRLVYSTCSMNFIENEAVVAHVLSKYRHALELVDVSAELPELLRRPGRATWKVLSEDGAEYTNPAEVPAEHSRRFPSSLFPRPEYAELALERCLRIYPHLQNTGGFFVAVIVKTREDLYGRDIIPTKEVSSIINLDTEKILNVSDASFDENANISDKAAVSEHLLETAILGSDDSEKDHQSDEQSPGTLTTPDSPPEETSIIPTTVPHKRQQPPAKRTAAETAFLSGEIFYRLDPLHDANLLSIFDFYGIDSASIQNAGFGFLVRSDRTLPRSITLVSSVSHSLLSSTLPLHPSTALPGANRSLRIVNAGVRVFELYESQHPLKATCTYRLLSESVRLLRPFLTKRLAVVEPSQIRLLLSSLDSIPTMPHLVEQLGEGGAVLECHQPSIIIPVWINHKGIKAFVPKANRPALLAQLDLK